MGQIVEITLMNLRSIPQRLGSSLVAIMGVAGVVGVLVAVLSMAKGFEHTLQATGSEDNVIVMRSGSSSELDSSLSGEQVNIIEQAPGLLRDEGRGLVSAELYVMVDLDKKSTGTQANVPFRGVGENAGRIRERFQLVEGRMFESGRRELIAGRGAADQFSGLTVGQTLAFGQERWDVVGIFTAGGSAAESELWTDAGMLQSAYRRGNSYNIAYARLASVDDLQQFNDALEADPRMSVRVQRETEYFAEQSAILSGFISGIGYGIAILMALGAVFGALNTMYTAVSDRTREIATLRALGFSRLPIVVSVMTEALALALLGGLLGGLIAWALFNGFTVSTLNFASFTQVVFAFAVTPGLLVQGIIIALIIGFLGGLAPAVRAARQPIATALRA
jgi:putative ABC transport system permease protein